MKTYQVTHFGYGSPVVKSTNAVSEVSAIKRLFGDMGTMKSVRSGFEKRFLRADGSVWFAVRTIANSAAQQLGQLGGRSKSSAKSEASRENGKLGGRPRKKKAV